MIADDLAPLLAQTGKLDDLGFHAGKVLAWNPETGANTVEVAGVALVDLPMLSLGDTVNLAVGDVVALLRFKSTMFIVGRIVLPGSGVLATSAVLPATGTVSANGYAITTTETVVVSTTLTAPAWSNAVTVFASIHATGRNQRGVVDYLYARVNINGSDGAQEFGQAAASPNPSFALASASYSGSGLLPGGTEFGIQGKVESSGGTWAADILNQCDLTYSVIYFRV